MTTNIKHLRPLFERVLVKLLEGAHKSASGIVIPGAVAENPVQGEVIAVGAGEILGNGKVRPLDVKVGDKVLFGKHAGQPVEIGGEEMLIMREADIITIL